MIIKVSDKKSIEPFLKKIYFPPPQSHKGQNGRVMIIGGSSLFHSASIWAAEIASHFVDMVHYCSTVENNQVMLALKKKFINGMVVSRCHMDAYIKEDDAILLGCGMVREGDEGKYTYHLVEDLLRRYPAKQWVLDAGALQVMEKEWLFNLTTPAIITPHIQEFSRLFKVNIGHFNQLQQMEIVKSTANQFRTVILLKAGAVDLVSDGDLLITIEGGNSGLTKGGTGDVLAGLTLALASKNRATVAATVASYLIKTAASRLFKSYKYWYNIANLIDTIPAVLANSI